MVFSWSAMLAIAILSSCPLGAWQRPSRSSDRSPTIVHGRLEERCASLLSLSLSLSLCVLSIDLLCVPGSVSTVLAGPNAGGALILHREGSLQYTDDIPSYCGLIALGDCESASTYVPLNEDAVFYVVAAFPSSSVPRVSGVAFGIDYDEEAFVLLAHGGCGDFELGGSSWPSSGSGTSVTWTAPEFGTLTEVYWFAGYGTESSAFALVANPSQGAVFADDLVPSQLDPIQFLGSLGFGASGNSPCPPSESDSGDGDGPIEGDGDTDNGPIGGDTEAPAILVKIDRASLTFPADVHSLALSEIRERSDVVISPPVLRAFENARATTVSRSIPNFDPRIVDRNGDIVRDERGAPLLVPNDMSLWFHVALEGVDTESVAARLRDTEGVAAAEEVKRAFVVTSASPPSDEYFDPQQWGLHNHGQYGAAPHRDINFSPVASYRPWAQARVGVIDSGIDFEHPDLSNVEAGINLLAPGQPPVDDFRHGTACSGIIAMDGDNEIGGTGVAPGATIVPVKAIDSSGEGTQETMVQALDWLRSEGVKVVNMSYRFLQEDACEKEALQNARAAGMACVAGMGNENSEAPVYPAGYSNHTLAVGAHTHLGDRWQDVELPGGPGPSSGSNWGDNIDLIAPGGRGIMTTRRHWDGNGFYDLEPMDPNESLSNDWIGCNGFGGTSAAAPMVCGVLAAIMGQNSEIDGEDAQEIAIRTATDVQPYGIGWDVQSGWGRPNLQEALDLVRVPNSVERGTAYSNADGIFLYAGCAYLVGLPGLEDGFYEVGVWEVEFSIPLTSGFAATPVAWPRVQGTVGYPPIDLADCSDVDIPEFHYADKDAGWAKVTNITATHLTMVTQYYDVLAPGGNYLGRFPSSCAVSYTAVGFDPTSSVQGTDTPLSTLTILPSPAREVVWIDAARESLAGIDLDVFDTAGRLVRSLSCPESQRGVNWNLEDRDGLPVASGIYFVRVRGLGHGSARKILVVR